MKELINICLHVHLSEGTEQRLSSIGGFPALARGTPPPPRPRRRRRRRRLAGCKLRADRASCAAHWRVPTPCRRRAAAVPPSLPVPRRVPAALLSLTA
jgi:hypothetical protein